MDSFLLNAAFPVEQLKVYGNGCYEVVRRSKLKDKPQVNPRGVIKTMSRNSISRLVVTIQATDVTLKSMITLTYPELFPQNGEVVKGDVGYYLNWLRKTYDGISYLWFLEFQKRGAPHIHLMTSIGELSPKMRVNAGLRWTERIVSSSWWLGQARLRDDERIYKATETWKMASFNCHPTFWELIRDESGAKHYVTKYAAKQYQKQVPEQFADVGRFWGCSRDVRPKVRHVIDVSDDEVREFLAKNEHVAADWEVLPKFLFNVGSSVGDNEVADCQTEG